MFSTSTNLFSYRALEHRRKSCPMWVLHLSINWVPDQIPLSSSLSHKISWVCDIRLFNMSPFPKKMSYLSLAWLGLTRPFHFLHLHLLAFILGEAHWNWVDTSSFLTRNNQYYNFWPISGAHLLKIILIKIKKWNSTNRAHLLKIQMLKINALHLNGQET